MDTGRRRPSKSWWSKTSRSWPSNSAGPRPCRLRAETATSDGERADLLATSGGGYDAILLDLGLPRVDGLTLLRRWREAEVEFPVLVLTARGSSHKKVQGIDGGADDYVAKPFRIEEVLARLRALIRRWSGQLQPELRIGPGRPRPPPASRVTGDGATVKLTGHEFGSSPTSCTRQGPGGRRASSPSTSTPRASIATRTPSRSSWRGLRRKLGADVHPHRARPRLRRCGGRAVSLGLPGPAGRAGRPALDGRARGVVTHLVVITMVPVPGATGGGPRSRRGHVGGGGGGPWPRASPR